jgi:hypothetical protein
MHKAVLPSNTQAAFTYLDVTAIWETNLLHIGGSSLSFTNHGSVTRAVLVSTHRNAVYNDYGVYIQN